MNDADQHSPATGALSSEKELDILTAVYIEHLVEARHHSAIRARTLQIFVVIYAALGASVQTLTATAPTVAAFGCLVLVGIGIASDRLYLRHRMFHVKRAIEIRRGIEARAPQIGLVDMFRRADQKPVWFHDHWKADAWSGMAVHILVAIGVGVIWGLHCWVR